MDLDIDEGIDLRENLKKYRLAGYGFLVLNLVYLGVAWVFLPPFNIGLSTIISIGGFLALVVLLTVYVCRGKRRLTQILAILYAGRAGFSIYSLATGEAFEAVFYVLPCLLLTCYLLGRAAWDWP